MCKHYYIANVYFGNFENSFLKIKIGVNNEFEINSAAYIIQQNTQTVYKLLFKVNLNVTFYFRRSLILDIGESLVKPHTLLLIASKS